MRSRTADVIVAWIIGVFALIAMCLALTGCGTFAHPTEAEETFTTVERALVDQTARFAAELGVSVRGKITSRLHPTYVNANAVAVAWYERGVAYYYRPSVARHVSLVPEPGKETVASIASHEVCHALYPHHEWQHWECNTKLSGQATYPRPGAPND